jgi:hypothetical protein
VRRVIFLMLEDEILLESAEMNDALLQELTSEEGIVKIEIRSGLEALSREIRREKMTRIMQTAAQLPPEWIMDMKGTGMVRAWLESEDVEPTPILKSEQEKAAEQQQMQAQQAMQAGIEAGARQGAQAGVDSERV